MLKKRKNFTLIELLLVIAIIGILASLLAPSLKKARDESKNALCTNNHKQIYSAQIMYTGDNNSYFTYADLGHVSWDDMLSDYDGRNLTEAQKMIKSLPKEYEHKLYMCPLAVKISNTIPERTYILNGGEARHNPAPTGIAWHDGGSVKMAEVADPMTMLSFETDRDGVQLGRPNMGNSYDGFNGTWSRDGNEDATKHHGGIYFTNITRVEGSVLGSSLLELSLWTRDED